METDSTKIINLNIKKEDRILELLSEVGIENAEERLNHFPHQLSGGQRQRVMIAMAIANNPKLLIADEPTTALDVTIQKQILDLLDKLRKKFQMSLLLITHDLSIVKKISDRVCVMKDGQIVEQGETKTLFKKPFSCESFFDVSSLKSCKGSESSFSTSTSLSPSPSPSSSSSSSS